ncbi:hypothetical protein B0H19DRAFT_1247578 [Mycena capillaripes]|nr:hypothetical protein B0H19DRAFT_1247578 [Mycena capillaripes]
MSSFDLLKYVLVLLVPAAHLARQYYRLTASIPAFGSTTVAAKPVKSIWHHASLSERRSSPPRYLKHWLVSLSTETIDMTSAVSFTLHGGIIAFRAYT